MQFKELVAVLNNKAYINIVSEKGDWLYEGKVMFITPNLLERKIKLVDVKRAFTNELFITMED